MHQQTEQQHPHTSFNIQKLCWGKLSKKPISSNLLRRANRNGPPLIQLLPTSIFTRRAKPRHCRYTTIISPKSSSSFAIYSTTLCHRFAISRLLYIYYIWWFAGRRHQKPQMIFHTHTQQIHATTYTLTATSTYLSSTCEIEVNLLVGWLNTSVSGLKYLYEEIFIIYVYLDIMGIH